MLEDLVLEDINKLYTVIDIEVILGDFRQLMRNVTFKSSSLRDRGSNLRDKNLSLNK